MLIYNMGKNDKTTTKTTAKKIVKKPTASPKPTPAPAPAPTPTPVVEKTETTEAPTDSLSVLETRYGALLTKFTTLHSEFGSTKKEMVEVGKLIAKEMKQARKLAAAKMKRAGNRAPAGFIKPTLISDELAKFLGKPNGEMMPRTAVTKEITSYIKAHSLQDPANGRTILPDAALAKLLKIKKDDTLTYFNLQRYMAPHFPSTGAGAAAAAAATSTA
jgi:chromatin remodeling complex protein RSC6